MISTGLKILENVILERLGEIAVKALADDVMSLSKSFTENRDELPHEYLNDPIFLRAYLAGFMLTNAAKVLHCLGEAADLGLILPKRSFRVLDLGCGPGTASLAASMFFSRRFPDARVEFTGVERCKAALIEAGGLFRRLENGQHSFKGEPRDIDWTKPADGLFDIVFAANVLNEINDDSRSLKLCQSIVKGHLAPGGFLIVIDPALKCTTRPLMKLRDELVADCVALLAPCLHNCPCPMLSANERDWCHFYIDWDRPKLIEELDLLTNLDHKHIRMAYLVLALKREVKGDEGSGNHRVVSSPIVSKGKRELFLCGADGALMRAMRQDKHASEENRGFELARRGDVVATEAGEKILPSDSFRVVRKWQ